MNPSAGIPLDYSKTPTPLPPSPRRVRLRPRAWRNTSGIMVGRLITLEPIERKQECFHGEMWRTLSANQPVTVLYRPQNPKRATVYECSMYHIPEADRGVTVRLPFPDKTIRT